VPAVAAEAILGLTFGALRGVMSEAMRATDLDGAESDGVVAEDGNVD
jgi:hypothetical protein